MTTEIPHDIAAEESLLGSMLLSRGATITALDAGITSASFYRPAHGVIFDAVVEVVASGANADPVTVAAQLNGSLERIGGQHELVRLQAATPASANAPRYVTIVSDRARRRGVMTFAENLRAAAADGDVDVDAAVAVLVAGHRLNAGTANRRAEPDTPSPDLDQLLAEPDPEFDWLIDGLIERGDRVIVTAPEGGGKSTLLRQVAVAVSSGLHPFTLEAITPVRTLLVDVENSRRHVTRKLRDLRAAAGDEYRGILHVETLTAGLDLTSALDADYLAKLVQVNQSELLVIGPLYKLALGDPSDERTARTVAATLDRLRGDFGCALLIEAHSPHSQSNGTRPLRPYGASLWLRWPEFGIGIGANGKITHWRGPRDERAWPRRLVRSAPWSFAVGEDIAPPDGTWRPTCLMERASRRLESLTASNSEPTRNALADATKGQRATVIQAIDFLVLDGFAELNGSKKLRSLKPYRETKP